MLLCYSYQTPNLILSSSLFFSLLLLAHLFSKLSSSIFISSLLLYLVTPSSSVVCICCFKFCSFTTNMAKHQCTLYSTIKPFLENAWIFRSCQQMKRGGRVVLIHKTFSNAAVAIYGSHTLIQTFWPSFTRPVILFWSTDRKQSLQWLRGSNHISVQNCEKSIN